MTTLAATPPVTRAVVSAGPTWERVPLTGSVSHVLLPTSAPKRVS